MTPLPRPNSRHRVLSFVFPPCCRSSFAWFLALLPALLAAASCTFAAPAVKPQTHRYAVLMLGSKVGTQTLRLQPITYQGRKAVKVISATDIKMQALTEVQQQIRASEVITLTGQPLRLDMQMTSTGRNVFIRAFFYPNRVACTHSAGGKRTRKVVRIPRGITLTEDPSLTGGAGSAADIEVGQKMTQHFFEPLTMSIQKFEMEVLRREGLRVGEESVDTFVLQVANQMLGEMRTWITPAGEFLKMESPLGLSLVREDLVGPEIAYTPPADFAVATSIRTERKITLPRQTRSLRVRFQGIPERRLVLTDGRQRAQLESAGDSLVVTYDIQATDPPTRGAPAATRRNDNPALADATYLNLTDPEIRRRAAQVAGAGTDRAAIARRIRAWVYAHMRRPSNVAVPRSAVEIMKSREGVCRDYATLFTALARAAGVPTRAVSGIIYAQEGFFYHAWVECQIGPGENDWVPYDPTLPTDLVDATHIKFAEGNVEDMFRAVRLVGQLKAEILEVK
ncbi:MAG: transglutaminase domain-containing protein [Armatimonadetes bacterium]|nr:transglutaminase domain-containing protein [Armatimonadota bacterium]